MTASRPALRSALRKLNEINCDYSDGGVGLMLPQEKLDILATLAGIKPLSLIGRGLDDKSWVAGAVAVLRGAGLRVTEGPYWSTANRLEGIHPWYKQHKELEEKYDREHLRAFYACRAPATDREVRAINAGGGIVTCEQEARLLGYPTCCVLHHHAYDETLTKLYGAMLSRVGCGDPSRMLLIIERDDALRPETSEEIALAQMLVQGASLPFTSISICPACTSDQDSPARKIGHRMKALAIEVDSDLAKAVDESSALLLRLEKMRS